MSKPGHNSKAKAGPVHGERLKSFVERIEKMEEERKAIAGDIRDIYAEAKGVGYDVGTMRKVVRLRAMDPADRAEQETLLDVYMHALGMVDRIDARLAAGESQRQIAEAEGVSKSTVQRRGSKVESALASSEMDHHDADGVIIETESSAGPDAGRSEQQPTAPISPASRTATPAAKPVPEGGEGTGTSLADRLLGVFPKADEARTTVPMQAEGRAVTDDDMPDQPPFLRRRVA